MALAYVRAGRELHEIFLAVHLLGNHPREIEVAMDYVVLVGVGKGSRHVNNEPEDTVHVVLWYHFQRREVAKLHRRNELVHVLGDCDNWLYSLT